MSKQNNQLEDILDELSVIKESVETYNTKLANIEALLSQQVSNESEKIESESSTLYIPENLLKEIVRQGIESYFNNEGLCSSILSDERIKLMGDRFIGMYAAELQKRWKQLDDKEEKNRKEYFHKRTIQGINTIAQMKEWASEYPPEIQRTIRFIGLKILDKDEPVETTHTILKIWGNALQAITNPKPPPTSNFENMVAIQVAAFQGEHRQMGHVAMVLDNTRTFRMCSLFMFVSRTCYET